MAKEDDFELKHVGAVAGIIGIIVVLLGFAGIFINLYT